MKHHLFQIITLVTLFTLSACSDKHLSQIEPKKPVSSQYSISQSEALNEVRMFLENIDSDTKSLTENRTIKNIESVTTEKLPVTKSINLPDTLLHIVNFENNRGYAVLAADRRIPTTLLAVIDEGNESATGFLPPTDIQILPQDMQNIEWYSVELDDYLVGENDTDNPKCMKSLIFDYAIKNFIEYYDESFTPNSPYSDAEWFTRCLKRPLVKTKWNQDPPFNDHYPHVGIGNKKRRAAAGCVPIAVAQILVCNKYPTAYPTFNGLQCDYKKMEAADISDPDSMDPEVRNMIATMMRKIADRCKCQYYTGGTFAYPTNVVEHVFKPYGYSSVAITKNKYNTTIVNKMISMLMDGYPVFIAAVSTNVFHAHAWVIDGFFERYKRDNHDLTQTYFHCNLGWGGNDNGYYYSGMFDTNNCPYPDPKTKSGTPYYYNKTWRIITYDLNN